MAHFPAKVINKLQFQLELVTFKHRGDIVKKEDLPADYVIFIKEGEFEIVRESLQSDKLNQFLDDNTESNDFANKMKLVRGS
jgi:CRP-like cAMP-binding protein